MFFDRNSCPTCRAPILRHALTMDFSDDLAILRNIHRMAEAAIAANDNIMQNAAPANNNNNNIIQNAAAVINNNANELLHRNNNQVVDDMEEFYELLTPERVRFEMPANRQVNFIQRFRRGLMNVRLGRRILLATEGEPIIHACEAIVWFEDDSEEDSEEEHNS